MSLLSYFVITLLLLLGVYFYVASFGADVEFKASDFKKFALDDIDTFIKDSESEYSDITPGAEKKIIWADKINGRTDLSFVYIHGYSASRQEVSPLSENIAKQLNANIFLTRLTGHGRTGGAMAEITVNKLLSDTRDAFEIGKLIGKKVVVIGLSTGATLATWLAVNEKSPELAGVILLSPNYGLIDPKANWLLKPGAKYWLPIAEGRTYQFEPANDLQSKYWTWKYPTISLIPMMELVNFVVNLPLQNINIPLLVLYSENDILVDIQKIKKVFGKVSSNRKSIDVITGVQGAQHHVLAGDILSPKTTNLVQTKVLDFLDREIKNR